MKKKQKINIFIYLFIISLFAPINLSYSNSTKYTLKRYDDIEYEYKNNSGDSEASIKYKIENLNRFGNEIRILKTRTITKSTTKPMKNGKYEGHYKIGNPYTILGKKYYPEEDRNYKEIGVASWYGEDFHNKKTANGETYNMNDYTAAHRTLPLPSMVKVTNLENGKSIIVRVNDRGPFAKDRIIDLSKKVANYLGFQNQGTTKVKVEFLKAETDKMLREFGLK